MAIPVVSAFNAPTWMEGDVEVLMWLTALVPAFLLTFYKGWRGVSLSLALGMVVLTLTQIGLLLLGAPQPNWGLLLGVIVVFVGVSLGLGYFAEILARERSRAEAAALRDPLTGLPNRRHASVFLDAAFAAAIRGTPLAVVIFDLDHFKAFNDNHGHLAGDEILKIFGDLMKRSTRRMDLSARFGGEEFITVLADCGMEEARGFAQRVLEGIRGTRVPWGRVTASAGVACFEEGMGTPDVLVAAADQALYRAKGAGRDRVLTWEPTGSDEPLEPQAPGVPQEVKAPRILVVDDDPEISGTLGRILKMLAYEPLVFSDSLEALAFLEGSQEEIALLLVDVLMPGMNGLTLVERVSRLRSGVPVLYMSGSIQGEVSWPGVPGASTGFLQKPLSIAELEKGVAEALGPRSVAAPWTPGDVAIDQVGKGEVISHG
jgi:diguanylate cyclase (GGDEF)-like protein